MRRFHAISTHSAEKTRKSKGDVKPRQRTQFSQAQQASLEHLFAINQYPSSEQKNEMERMLGISQARLQVNGLWCGDGGSAWVLTSVFFFKAFLLVSHMSCRACLHNVYSTCQPLEIV